MIIVSILPFVALMPNASPSIADEALASLQDRVVGRWVSIACEFRPQQNQQADDKVPSASCLTRDIAYDDKGEFKANFTLYADPA